jgi:hypothetical protein
MPAITFYKMFFLRKIFLSAFAFHMSTFALGADYMDRASPVYRAEKCHENLPWAAK